MGPPRGRQMILRAALELTICLTYRKTSVILFLQLRVLWVVGLPAELGVKCAEFCPSSLRPEQSFRRRLT